MEVGYINFNLNKDFTSKNIAYVKLSYSQQSLLAPHQY